MKNKIKILDVGARGGVDMRWKPYHKVIEVLAFEPDVTEYNSLKAKDYPYKISILPYALGDMNDQKATLYICKQPGCSSTLKPNTKLCKNFDYSQSMQIVDEKPIELNRFDSVCGGFAPDFLKIDTQGTELFVLKGMGKMIDNVLAVEIEVEFVQQYISQPLFSDIDNFMRDHGFMLRGIKRSYWRNIGKQIHPYGGQLIHGDALYIKLDKINCEKGHIILAAFKQYDLLSHYGIFKLIPKVPLIIRVFAKILKGFSNKEMRRFVDQLRIADANDWHDPEFF